MSLLKIINGANNDKDFIPKIHEYIVDDVKTDKGQLVGTSNCFRKHAVKDFMTVKKLHHKTHGRQGIHMVLSITPDIPENSDEVYMDIADEIASYFSEYQSVYSVHKDTRHRHIHMVLNSVSYETGKKFSQSKQELNQLKGYFNHVLSDYELDIIKTKTDDILDENPYNFDDGFDFLEIDYDEEENEITIYDDNDYDAPYISEEPCSHIEKTRKTEENALVITGVNNESEDIFMNNNKFFEHANTNCNYENEVPFDVQSDPIYNQQIPTQIPQPYMSPVPSAPQFYPEPVPQNMYLADPPVNPQQYPVPDAYQPYAEPTPQNMYHTNPPMNPQQYPVPDAYQPYAGPTQQNMYPTNLPMNPQQYPVPNAYQPYAGPTPQNMYPTNPPMNPQQYPVPNTYQPYAEPTQQNMYPTNPPVNLQQYPTLFINHNQNLNIRVSETADPEITNRYITHFANIPNESIDKVKLGMAVMHKFNQQNTNVNVVIGMDKNVNIDLVGLSDEDEETDGEIIDIPNRK